MKQERNESRRQFIQQSAVLGTGVILAGVGAQRLFAQGNQRPDPAKMVASKGYAARDTSGKLSPWSFERRPVGDDDILIEIKFCGICHSDIHQLRGDWGPQKYPQVPGHEI
ncbi:MAG: NAD(P)-dependent alcohol dehydrogenase, partial [Verrucomicrobia bacterium]